MALVVEDGTGVPNAESYLSVSGLQTYCANRNLSLGNTVEVNVLEAALRVATEYLEGRYYGKWYGTPSTETQALSWPRENVSKPSGGFYAVTAMPAALLAATAQIAQREVTNPGSLLPDSVSSQRIKSKSVGPVSVTYADSSSSSSSDLPNMPVVEDLLRPLLSSGNSGLGYYVTLLRS
jgi:hypothetical protein